MRGCIHTQIYTSSNSQIPKFSNSPITLSTAPASPVIIVTVARAGSAFASPVAAATVYFPVGSATGWPGIYSAVSTITCSVSTRCGGASVFALRGSVARIAIEPTVFRTCTGSVTRIRTPVFGCPKLASIIVAGIIGSPFHISVHASFIGRALIATDLWSAVAVSIETSFRHGGPVIIPIPDLTTGLSSTDAICVSGISAVSVVVPAPYKIPTVAVEIIP